MSSISSVPKLVSINQNKLKKVIGDDEVIDHDSGNEYTYDINATSLLPISSELCNIVDIITLSDEAKYYYKKFVIFQLILQKSSTNSLESSTPI